jgi:hypothetical protein
MKADSLKANINQTLEALRLEANLGMHAEGKEEKNVTLNISHSTIAGLNLGTVIGDLTASVQTLDGSGQKELAERIKVLAEAIANSATVQEALRKEMLEHLSFVSSEASLPSGQRKLGPVISSVAFLRDGLS